MRDDIGKILDSDLLERYVLGDVSKKESERVNKLRQEYPAINEALEKFEVSLEYLAIQNAKPAPDSVRTKIIRDISANNNQALHKGDTSIFKILIGLVAGILIGGSVVYFLTFEKLNSLEKKIQVKEMEYAKLSQDCQTVNNQFAFINDADTKPAILTGTSKYPDSEVVIYWNEKVKKSMMRIAYLPAIPDNKTYQLWADVDGEMMSLGTFNLEEAQTNLMATNFLENATSLNITIEPLGGSKHPDVSKLTASSLI